MKIVTPVYINEIGNRNNNEDSIYPEESTAKDALFLVCDGVGGHEKGEVASSLVCKHMAEFINKKDADVEEVDFLAKALKHTEKKLVEYISADPGLKGMASTLTLIKLLYKKEQALVGWVGDSRVYHLRNGEILFQTKDHSEVQNLLDMGEITQEEAENYPRKNVITRAVSGVRPTRIDHKVIEDIRKDDFFLLCTDGILETLDEDKIRHWFTSESTAEEVKAKILKNASGKTQDNYSMYLIKIKETNTEQTLDPQKTRSATAIQDTGSENNKTPKTYLKIVFFILLLLLGFCLYKLWYLGR